jgi:hypothetical protein
MNDDDELDELLMPAGSCASPELRDRLREMTSSHVRLAAISSSRRSLVRWLVTAAALAACYVAGGATVWLIRPTTATAVLVEHEPPKPEPPATISPPELPQSPRELEIAAEKADGAESSRLFFEAGRRYLSEWKDRQSALRCYRNALDLLPETPVIDPRIDDWLLVDLKTDRRREHENP